MSGITVRFRPGIQTTTSTDEGAQRAAIAAVLDQYNIQVQVAPGRVVTGAALAAMSAAEVSAFGLNFGDVWQLLDDAADEANRGQIIDLRSRDIGQRYGLIDRLDGNYATSHRDTAAGTVSVAEASTPAGGSFTHRQWYHYLYEWLAELFTGFSYQSAIWDEPDRQVEVGRQMFDRAPASVSALINNDASRAQFREYLLTQRPGDMDEDDWGDVVDNMLTGMTERAAANAATVARADTLPTIPARDAYLLAYMHADAATRPRLDALRDAAAALPALEAEALLSPLEGTPAAREFLLDNVDTLRAMNPIVRNQANAVIAALTASEAPKLRLLLQSPDFNSTILSDMDRREALRLWGIPALRPAVFDFVHMMTTPQWTLMTDESKQRFIRLATTNGTSTDLTALSHMWLSLTQPGAGYDDLSEALLDILTAHPTMACDCVDQLPFLQAVARHPVAVREDIIRGFNAERPANVEAWTELASIQFPPEATGLSNVLYGTGTLDPGASGHSVIILQRYLAGLTTVDPITKMDVPRYPGLGITERPTYDAATEATVRAFQHDAHLPETGRLDHATAMALVREVSRRGRLEGQERGIHEAPGGFHFMTTMSLNRPTAATDGWWTPTRHWRDSGVLDRWHAFAPAYMRQRINTGERVDCADLYYETMIVFARQMGLPFDLNDGTRIIRHSTRGIPIAATVRTGMSAAQLRPNTVPVMDAIIPSDFFSLDWDQSLDGRDNVYNHTAPVDHIDPASPADTFLIYGSLTDYIEPSALAAYSAQYGITPVLHEISEYNIIDAINPDAASEDRRRPPEVYRPRIKTLLQQYGVTNVTEVMIDDFVAMVNRSTRRDGPTVVETASGVAAYSWAMGRDLYADPGLLEAARVAFNTRYHVAVRLGDMQGINKKGSDEEALEEARRLVGLMPAIAAADREAAAVALRDACNGTRRARRLPFERWDRTYP